MFFKVTILLLLLSLSLSANNQKDELIAIVKISKAKVRSQPSPKNKYIVMYYRLGDVLYLDYCDKYDWCKLKDKELYMSKATLGIMSYNPKKTQSKTITKKLTTKKTIQKKKKSSCIKLQKINIDENTIISKSEQNELLAHYLQKCINGTLLQNILHTLSQRYIEEGYITTKPYLKEQNIQDGEVDVTILKGYVEDIIHRETNSSDGRIATAFLFQKGESLNLRDLETSLEMLNRVPSYKSKFSIQPGENRGGSIITIETKKATPYRFSLGVIGEKQDYEDNPYFNADFSIDNLLNINDILTLRYNGSRVQSYYQSNSGAEVDYSFPLSSYLISYTWFKFQYSQAVLGLNDTYRASGDTIGSNLKISKILHRNQNNKLEGALSLQYKNNKNYFSNELINVSSYRTTLLQVDLTDTYLASWGQLRNTLSYYRGTNWLGSRDDSAVNTDEKLQFTKFSLDTNLLYNLPIPSYQINSNAHIQYTQDLLYDSNKVRIGSYYTVRGYGASYYGNNGYYLRNDFIKTFYPNVNKNLLQTLSPFFGLDYGAAKCEKNTPQSCGSLAGTAIGVKTTAKNLETEFTLSRGLKRIPTQDFQNLFRYSLIFRY